VFALPANITLGWKQLKMATTNVLRQGINYDRKRF
jgi:hypothetical protein